MIGEDKMIDYYNEYLPGVKPLNLYRNTKFLTAEKINGGLLTDDEINSLTLFPTGHCFDLKDSGYFVLDMDVNENFKYRNEMDISDEAKLLGYSKTEFPESIQVTEYTLNKGKSVIKSTNDALIALCEMLDTRFVKTPSKSFHFYFTNDLTKDQMEEIFGMISPKYIKCFSLFGKTIDVDIFMDIKTDSNIEARLVLPFTKIIAENKLANNHPDVNKLVPIQYSGIREYKNSGFKKASCLIKWLKSHVTPLKHSTVNQSFVSSYSSSDDQQKDMRIPLDVFESDKPVYLSYMRKNFKIIGKTNTIKTYDSYPFNLYLLMCVIAFFPICMHYDLIMSFIDILKSRLSKNAKELLLTYYYDIRTKESHRKNWKGPQYLEAIISSQFDVEIKNKYRFIVESDKMEKEESSEEVICGDETKNCFNDPLEVVKAVNKSNPDFPLPRNLN